jgi:2-desacetyl-2-hydroxyethyl bacteriochlorophyllide A dehydrogenase
MTNPLVKNLQAIGKKLPEPMFLRGRAIFHECMLIGQALSKRARVVRTPQVRWLAPEVVDYMTVGICGPGGSEVLVEAETTAMSPGTELAAFLGLPGATRGFPYNPGYSGVGRVVAAGRNVQILEIGTRVAGRLSHSRLSVVKSDFLFPIGEDLDPEAAAMIELGIIALQGVRKARIRVGEPVVVVGCGVIGQIAMRLARIAGASPVIAVARSGSRKEAALAPGGADLFFETGAGDVPLRSPVVFEVTGDPRALQVCLPWVATGGDLVLLGSSRGITAPIALAESVAERGVRLVGGHVTIMPKNESSPRRWTYRSEGLTWLQLMEQQRFDVRPLVTHRLKAAGLPSFYNQLADGIVHPVGVLVDWAEGRGQRGQHAHEHAR